MVIVIITSTIVYHNHQFTITIITTIMMWITMIYRDISWSSEFLQIDCLPWMAYLTLCSKRPSAEARTAGLAGRISEAIGKPKLSHFLVQWLAGTEVVKVRIATVSESWNKFSPNDRKVKQETPKVGREILIFQWLDKRRFCWSYPDLVVDESRLLIKIILDSWIILPFSII